MIAHLTFQIQVQNVSDCYFCLLYNSSCVTAFTTTLCFYYYSVVNPRTLEGLLFAVSHVNFAYCAHFSFWMTQK